MKYILRQEKPEELYKIVDGLKWYSNQNNLKMDFGDSFQEGIEKGWLIVPKNFFDSLDIKIQTKYKRPVVVYGMDDWNKLSELPVGCYVDTDVYDYFLNVLPPLGQNWNWLLQVSEAVDEVNGMMTYNTFGVSGYTGVWKYCGACWRNRDWTPVQGKIHILIHCAEQFGIRVNYDPINKTFDDFIGEHHLHKADAEELRSDLLAELKNRSIRDLDVLKCQATMGGWMFNA